MRIAVCVEQILAPEAVVHLNRTQLSVVVTEPAYAPNPTDNWAVAEALRLGDAHHIGVFTLAPSRGDSLLRSYLAAGVDEAVRLWDPALEDADELERARVVATAMQLWSADVVMCGNLLGEKGTQVLGPMVAELLDVPQVTAVVGVAADDGDLVTRRRVDGFQETVRCSVPAVVTVDRGRPLPYPTLPNRIRARTAVIEIWDLAHLGIANQVLPNLSLEVVAVSTPKPQRKTLVDARPALERTVDLLLGGTGSGGGGTLLDGETSDMADRVVARCLPVLRTW